MTDRLFKFGSFEDEIMKSMETTLVKYQKDQMYSHEKLGKAIDHLSAAAEIFDDTGFNKEAEALTKFIEKIAHEKGGLDSKLIDEELTGVESGGGSELEELMNQLQKEDLSNPADKKYKPEFDDMVSSLHDPELSDPRFPPDPLVDLKRAFNNLKKKVI